MTTRTRTLAALLMLSLAPWTAGTQDLPDAAQTPAAPRIGPGVLGAAPQPQDPTPGHVHEPPRPGQDDGAYYDGRRRKVPIVVVVRDRDYGLPPKVTLTEPEATAPAPEAPAAVATPLNAHAGPRFVGARGAAPAAAAWTLNQPLPRGVPQLTLTDWRAYGLDAPGPGQSYARVGGDVLLIESATRRVVRALPPPG